ncbi:MAG: hypothetical protein QM813_07020 [Verrucomicrobiota bacterium]
MKPRCTIMLVMCLAVAGLTVRSFGATNDAGGSLTQGQSGIGRPSAITAGQRVFTAGNSFHAWYIAPILQDVATNAGFSAHSIVGVSKIGGSRAIQHWDVPEEKNEAKAALRAGRVDVLTLACMLHPDEGIDKFAGLAVTNNSNARVVLQEFWIPWDKFEWPFQGKESDVDFDAATSAKLRALHEPYFKEMDAYVTALNTRLGKPVVFVAPVGQAVVALREKIIAGEVPGIAKQSELFTDKLGIPIPPSKRWRRIAILRSSIGGRRWDCPCRRYSPRAAIRGGGPQN